MNNVDVDLSFVRLPEAALMFPAPPTTGEDFDICRFRNPGNVTREFEERAEKLGFPIRFHDLRASHETALLDSGVPDHTVDARCGHDPAVLLRSYARRTKKADESAAVAIRGLSKGVLDSVR
jgi:integrase